MTPAERLVVECAIRLAATGIFTAETAELIKAVEALQAERGAMTPEERVTLDITWGQVAEGDEVWSERTQRWYPVAGAVRHIGAPSINVAMLDSRGAPMHTTKAVSDPVRVRRGQTGQAVDAIATVLWSR